MDACVYVCAVVSVCILTCLCHAVGSPRQDREALQALYWSSGGPRWKRNQGWADNEEDMSSWHGVTLDKDGRVLRIDLNRNSLDGE